MARKKSQNFVHTVKGVNEFKEISTRLRNEGFEPLTAFNLPQIKRDTAGKELTWDNFISSELRRGQTENGKSQRRTIPTLYFSSGNEVMAGTEQKGSENLGYIEWGLGNKLPNVVALLTQMLPYTAAGMKFNNDMLAGLGPQPMYDITQYVGGNISTKSIRYKDAGVYLSGRINDKRRELVNLMADAEGSDRKGTKAFSDLCAGLTKDIERLENDYKVWKSTYEELKEFLDNNNLAQTWLSLSIDQVMFGISFPELLINKLDIGRDGKPVETAQWNPKVVGLSCRSCHTTRLERKDDEGRINYVYSSNRWLDTPFFDNETDANAPINAIPALNTASPLASMREYVMTARMNNVPVNKRPTRFVFPSIYPTAGRPYYPTPAWHSIFGGDIYEYLSTIISDRFNRKRNSNIIGRVIYIHHDYLRQMATQVDAEGNSMKIEEIRDKLYEQINTWLSNRNNAGQSLLAFTFMGTDGNEHKSFEVVEVASTNKSSVEANEKETAEISSIVFMTLGLDARLLGSSPMSLVGSNGGTDIRERFLLRQILMSPTQNLMIKPLEVLSRFNGWDEHLTWDIKRQVMTTLDRSKSGVTTQETE